MLRQLRYRLFPPHCENCGRRHQPCNRTYNVGYLAGYNDARVETEASYDDTIERRASAKADARERAARAQREQERGDAEYASYERTQALQDLERARVWHDEYAEQRALDKLKRYS